MEQHFCTFTICCSFPNGIALLHFSFLLFLFQRNGTCVFAVPFPKEHHVRFCCSFSKGTALLVFAVPFFKGTTFAFSHFFVCIFAFCVHFLCCSLQGTTLFLCVFAVHSKKQHFGSIFESNLFFLLWDYS